MFDPFGNPNRFKSSPTSSNQADAVALAQQALAEYPNITAPIKPAQFIGVASWETKSCHAKGAFDWHERPAGALTR